MKECHDRVYKKERNERKREKRKRIKKKAGTRAVDKRSSLQIEKVKVSIQFVSYLCNMIALISQSGGGIAGQLC